MANFLLFFLLQRDKVRYATNLRENDNHKVPKEKGFLVFVQRNIIVYIYYSQSA